MVSVCISPIASIESNTFPFLPIPIFSTRKSFNVVVPVTFKPFKVPNCSKLDVVIPVPISLLLNIVVPSNLYSVAFTIPLTSNKYCGSSILIPTLSNIVSTTKLLLLILTSPLIFNEPIKSVFDVIFKFSPIILLLVFILLLLISFAVISLAFKSFTSKLALLYVESLLSTVDDGSVSKSVNNLKVFSLVSSYKPLYLVVPLSIYIE